MPLANSSSSGIFMELVGSRTGRWMKALLIHCLNCRPRELGILTMNGQICVLPSQQILIVLAYGICSALC